VGQQAQDEMPVGSDVEDGLRGETPDVLGGESALEVDKGLRMGPRFEYRLGKNLKRTRILAKKGESLAVDQPIIAFA
jgi:hypothetical protein